MTRYWPCTQAVLKNATMTPMAWAYSLGCSTSGTHSARARRLRLTAILDLRIKRGPLGRPERPACTDVPRIRPERTDCTVAPPALVPRWPRGLGLRGCES